MQRSFSLVRLTHQVLPHRPMLIKRTFADMMPLTFACPGQVFYNNTEVRQVDVPLTSGSVGILPKHVPVIGTIKAGVVTVLEEKHEEKFFVSSGTLTVNDDASVQLIAEEAVKLVDLDPQCAREGVAEAQKLVSSASSDEEKAVAQIQVETLEEIQRTLG